MNFTREPLIETIITPKEGYNLTIRSSRGQNLEEYSVDAVEVVSFGQSLFFRSLDRTKSFLVPVADYEVLETRETRVVLKKPTVEKTIQIGKKLDEQPVQENDRKKRLSRRRRVAEKEAAVKAEKTARPEVQEQVLKYKELLRPPPGLISEKISSYKQEMSAEQDLFESQKIAEHRTESVVEEIPTLYESEEIGQEEDFFEVPHSLEDLPKDD